MKNLFYALTVAILLFGVVWAAPTGQGVKPRRPVQTASITWTDHATGKQISVPWDPWIIKTPPEQGSPMFDMRIPNPTIQPILDAVLNPVAKDQFETRAEFEQRKQKAEAALQGYLSQPLFFSPYYVRSYDADSEVLKVQISTSRFDDERSFLDTKVNSYMLRVLNEDIDSHLVGSEFSYGCATLFKVRFRAHVKPEVHDPNRKGDLGAPWNDYRYRTMDGEIIRPDRETVHTEVSATSPAQVMKKLEEWYDNIEDLVGSPLDSGCEVICPFPIARVEAKARVENSDVLYVVGGAQTAGIKRVEEELSLEVRTGTVPRYKNAVIIDGHVSQMEVWLLDIEKRERMAALPLSQCSVEKRSKR